MTETEIENLMRKACPEAKSVDVYLYQGCGQLEVESGDQVDFMALAKVFDISSIRATIDHHGRRYEWIRYDLELKSEFVKTAEP